MTQCTLASSKDTGQEDILSHTSAHVSRTAYEAAGAEGSLLSPALRTPQLTPSTAADTDNRARTLESEHLGSKLGQLPRVAGTDRLVHSCLRA